MKKLVQLIPALSLVTIMGLMMVPPAAANPPGAPDDAKLAFNFDYIATPNGNVGCGAGHRIFTLLGQAGQILWTYIANGGIGIDDCMTQSIDGDVAEAHADLVGTYLVYVRLLGPNVSTNTLHICRDGGAVYTGLCLLGEVTLTRTGTDRITFPKKLFDDGFVNELWSLDPGSSFRIAQIRLYRP